MQMNTSKVTYINEHLCKYLTSMHTDVLGKNAKVSDIDRLFNTTTPWYENCSFWSTINPIVYECRFIGSDGWIRGWGALHVSCITPGSGSVTSRRAKCRYAFCTSIGAILFLLVSSVAHAADEAPAEASDENQDLVNLSIEELLNVEVTSVSKKKERKQNAAAAIYVLTQDDIRRSGATNVPELLRTVPGIEVARLTASSWSVTARGFGGRFSNKLLVLIDGRSIYTPLYSGVYWEGQEVMLEDVDRVEIIRGPGGTLWGANAVNGVINIVTKKASDTQGLLISGGGGTEERGFANVRWGGDIADEADYRLYLRGFHRDAGGDHGSALEADDAWENIQGGFRVDWNLSTEDTLTLQGDIRDLNLDQVVTRAILDDPFTQTFNETADYDGANLLLRWTRTFADESELSIQTYYDGYTWDDPTFREHRDTFDIELQHRFRPSERHDIVWGLGIRATFDDTDGSEFITLDPDDDSLYFFSAFIEDDIKLLDELHLIVGTKLEHNTYTGFEVQPSARIRWTPTDRHTVWAAISRAVRTPSRAENAARLRNLTAPGAEFLFVGSDDFKSEDLFATELGYRVRATERLAFDLALFYNIYDNIRSVQTLAPVVTPDGTIFQFQGANGTKATTYGFELAADWAVTERWKLRAGYSLLQIDLDTAAGDPISESLLTDTPEQQFFLHSGVTLPHNIEFDTILRAVDSLSGLDVPGYADMDARIAWRPTEDLELALVGQNLLHGGRYETAASFISNMSTQVERGVYAKLTWKFQPGSKR